MTQTAFETEARKKQVKPHASSQLEMNMVHAASDRQIGNRRLVLRKQLKAYGLDTTTHTRGRLCNRTSETLRHLDGCPVVRAVFAQGESLNIQPPRLLTIIGTSADTPEVHNALHLHMWNQIIVSFYEEEEIKPEQTWKAA